MNGKITSNSHTKLLKIGMLSLLFVLGIIFRLPLIESPFPSGDDPGAHLTFTKLIIANNGAFPVIFPYHVWIEPIKYPLGYHWVIAHLVMFTHMPTLEVLRYFSLIISFFVPLSVYYLTVVAFKNEVMAMFAMFFSATSPVEVHVMSWGGYPQMLALLVIILMTAESFNFIRTHSIIRGLLIWALSTLTTFIHPLSFFISFLVIALPMSIFGVCRKATDVGYRGRVHFLILLITWMAGGAILPFMPWFNQQLLESGIGQSWKQYAISITSTVKWFSDPFLGASLTASLGQFRLPVCIASVLLIPLKLIENKWRYSFYIFYFSMLTLLVASQGFFIDMYVYHPGRFLIFILPSLYILLGLTFFTLVNRLLMLHSWRKIMVTPFLFLLLVAVVQYSQGSVYVNYHQSLDEATFEALCWLKQNTDNSAIVLAEHSHSFWVQAIAERRTVEALLAPPDNIMYREMSEDANFLLNTESENLTKIYQVLVKWHIDYVMITNKTHFGQQPLNTRFDCFSPLFVKVFEVEKSNTKATIYRVQPLSKIIQIYLGETLKEEYFFNFGGNSRLFKMGIPNGNYSTGFLGIYIRRAGHPPDLQISTNNTRVSIHYYNVKETGSWIFVRLDPKDIMEDSLTVSLKTDADHDVDNWYSIGVDTCQMGVNSYYFDYNEGCWKKINGEYLVTLILLE